MGRVQDTVFFPGLYDVETRFVCYPSFFSRLGIRIVDLGGSPLYSWAEGDEGRGLPTLTAEAELELKWSLALVP